MSEESKELDGNVSTAELLREVKTAIRKILIGGQSYQIGSRKLTRADLYQLRKLKEELEAEIAAEGDTSLLDNTYVAFFDGRCCPSCQCASLPEARPPAPEGGDFVSESGCKVKGTF